MDKLVWIIDIILAWFFFFICDLHFESQFFKPSEYNKSTKWLEKNPLPYISKGWILLFSKLSYGLLCNQMHPMNMTKHIFTYLFIHYMFLISISLLNAFIFIPFIKRCSWTFDIISLRDSKGHLYNVQVILNIFK